MKMLTALILFFALLNGKAMSDVINVCISKNCDCYVDDGEWVASCKSLPSDIIKSTDIDVLELKICPSKDWILPVHMELRKVTSFFLFFFCWLLLFVTRLLRRVTINCEQLVTENRRKSSVSTF